MSYVHILDKREWFAPALVGFSEQKPDSIVCVLVIITKICTFADGCGYILYPHRS